MRPLNKKLWRDAWHLRGQVVAIALVMASGIGLLVMGLTALEALQETARAYYERNRFAQVFAHVERAPSEIAARIANLPGVQTVDARIARMAVLDVAGFNEPVTAQLISLPSGRPQTLNLLTLRAGRLPEAAGETVLSEPFATAHRLTVGSTLRATLNNKWRTLRVVGIVLSPEYVYAIGPGTLMPDDQRFGVIWMIDRELQAAFDLTGAFNDVTLTLLRGVDPNQVIERLDMLLAPYGSIGAYARADQTSNWFLMNEIAQLKTMSRSLPVVFLLVTAFLSNMVLSRLIAMERAEIGLLKAFGYTEREVMWHYVKFVAIIGVLGVALGWTAGYFLGQYETQLYGNFYHFPFLLYQPTPTPFLLAAVAGFTAALLGALRAVRAAATLPPAQAMQAPAPTAFARTRLSRTHAWAQLEHLTRIVLRQIVRWPLRSITTCLGIAMAVAVLVTSMQWLDAIERAVSANFREAQWQDVTVSFATPRADTAAAALRQLPGVLSVEPMHIVRAKLKSGWRTERESLQALPSTQQLYRVYDVSGRAQTLPADGLVVATMLEKMLHVRRGDLLTVELLQGRREVFELPIVADFETYIGAPAYIEFNSLARILKERPTVSSVHLRVDALRLSELLHRLKDLPGISGITIKAAAIQNFLDSMAKTITIFISFFIVFSCALAVGVTYNAARIALSERGRELATLRVLGFTRLEISYLLLGEIALLTLLALPLGCVIGRYLGLMILKDMSTEMFRVPDVIDHSTYGWAMLVVLIATVCSALLVRARIDRLDLIAVLKTRE